MPGRSVLNSAGSALQEYLHAHRRAVYLFVTAIVLRLLYFVFMLGQVTPGEMAVLSPDVENYMAVARGFAGIEPVKESALFLFGWGYPAFLWFCSIFTGFNAIWLVLIHIILSSLSCVIIYRLAVELIDSESVGLTAGYIAAFSFTSISLANFLLSDTLFFFLFALGNLWFVRGLKSKSRKYFILSGIIFAYAVCTRSMAQFWPLVMIALLFAWPLLQSSTEKKKEILRYLKIGFWAPLIVIVVMASWMIRNEIVHDLPIMAFAGPHGVGKVVANAQGELDGRDMRAVWGDWVREYQQATGKDALTESDLYAITGQKAAMILAEHSGVLIGTYFRLMWENIVANNELYFSQFPKYSARIQYVQQILSKKGHTKVLFLFAFIGGILTLIKYRAAAIYLGVLYVNVALMAGFGQWQGSRLFFPAMLAEAIFIGFFIIWAYAVLSARFFPRISPFFRRIGEAAVIHSILEVIRRAYKAVYSYFAARPFLFAVFVLSVLMRFGFYLFMAGQLTIANVPNLAPDSVQYLKIADGILGSNLPNEYGIMIFGPGFGAFLAAITFFLGSNAILLQIIQHIIAAASVLILYEVAVSVSKSNAVGIIAAVLYATSFTAISLANLILSDNLFFCLYLLSILLLLKSLRRFSWWLVSFSGIILGYAILVRSIGQFLIVVLLLIPLLYIKEKTQSKSWKERLRWYARYTVAPLIALVIIGGWMVRNEVVHDKAILAFTGAGGPSNIALRAIASEEGRETDEVYTEWVEAYSSNTGLTELSLSDDYEMRMIEVRKALRTYPGAMLSTYLDLTWENLTVTNELYFQQCPKYKYDFAEAVVWYKDHGWNTAVFWLTMFGFVLMIFKRQWRLFLFTAMIFFYFAGLVGFTQYQGSRLFFPGLVPCFISIGFLMHMLYSGSQHSYLSRLFKQRASDKSRNDCFLSESSRVSVQGLTQKKTVWLFGAVLVLGLIVLYRKFIFSDDMLRSADMINAGVFFREYMVQFVREYGHIPYWNSVIYCGLPFIDSFHGDIFYPLSFLKFFNPIE